MAKVAGRICEVYFDGVKIGNRLDTSGIGGGYNTIDSGDADGPGKELGQPELPDLQVTVHYNEGDLNQKAVRDALGDDNPHDLEFRPAGTGSGKTKLTGTCKVSRWEMGAPINGMETIVFTFAMLGLLTEGTQA
jgi:hypothetical protein